MARKYYFLQGVAGLIWWTLVFLLEPIRVPTLGHFHHNTLLPLDLGLFVAPSLAIPFLNRTLACLLGSLVGLWTAALSLTLIHSAWTDGVGGYGAMLMGLAFLAQLCALATIWYGRFPAELLLVGPLGFRQSTQSGWFVNGLKTLIQIAAFWGFFLWAMPNLILRFEVRANMSWGALRDPAIHLLGLVLLVALSLIGLWSARIMVCQGAGTPLPSDATRHLVTSGPYRWVRNPMAVAGIGQGISVGLMLGSWLTVLYALIGSVAWNVIARPLEEADLLSKFGDDYRCYQQRVKCWIPVWPRRDQ